MQPDPRRLDELLSAAAASSPAFAADGRLYFLDDQSGSAQVWELPADGAAARPRTTGRDPVSFVAASPVDGSAMFGRDDAGDERVQLYVLGADVPSEPRALTAQPQVIHGWGAFSPDGARLACTSNARDPAHADPYVLDAATGQSHRIAELAGPRQALSWRPDGQAVVLSSAPSALQADLDLLDVRTGCLSALSPHGGVWRSFNPRWRRDGQGLWLLTDRGRDFLAAAFLALGDPAPDEQDGMRLLHAPEADVEMLEVSPDQSVLAVSVNAGGWSRLLLLDAASGAALTTPGHPPGVVTRLSWRPDGTAVAFDLASPARPSSLWIAERGAAEARLLFAASEPPAELRDWRSVEVASFDGLLLPAFLAEPAGSPPPSGWPVLVWVHGGPEAQALPTWRPDLQAVLSLGIAVLVPNVRGSTGYGRAYASLDDRDKRFDAVRDLASLNRWLAAQERFDGARIGIWGQSYGGWMVLSAVTEQPELWACGVDFYGIARWKTFFERTGPWRIAHRAAEYGDPVRDAGLLERLSPLNKADRIRCPMLVAQGLTDPRVPPEESAQIVAALRGRGVPVEALTFADEGHGFLKRSNRREALGTALAFLARHLLARQG